MDTNTDLSAPLLERRRTTGLGRMAHCLISISRQCFAHKKDLAVCSGPVVAGLMWGFLHIRGDDDGKIASMIAILSWVFIWWVTDAIPIAVTALAPLFLLPFAEIETASVVAKSYMNDTIFLLIGSFILAAAVEYYNIHKRMALSMLIRLGGKKQKKIDPWLLLLGFCVGPAFVSMWIHNTAAAVMMMPVGLGVLQNTISSYHAKRRDVERGPLSHDSTAYGGSKEEASMQANTTQMTADNTHMTVHAESPTSRQGKGEAVTLLPISHIALGNTQNTEGEGEAQKSMPELHKCNVREPQKEAQTNFEHYFRRTSKNLKQKDVLEEVFEEEERRVKGHVLNFCKAVVLAIAFGVTLGGMATLTGTGVNLILAGLYESDFPTAEPITYLQWSMFGCPLAWLMVMALWLILCLWFCPRSSVTAITDSLQSDHIYEEFAMLGPMSFAELTVLGVFGVLVILWLTKSFSSDIKGWADFFDGYPGNGTISVLMATLLFIIPSKREVGEKLMDWKRCKSIPWGIILLLGGGFALADGMSTSGLSDYISDKLDFLQSTPYLLITPVIATLTGVMTEFTSNNSTATIFVSLVAEVATSIGLHPLFLMVPAAIGSQFSFMLPIATPANAIGYSPGYLTMVDMVTIGLMLKVTGIILLSILMPTLGAAVFHTN